MRFEQVDRFPGYLVVDVELHRQDVPIARQLNVQTLGQAIKAVAQQEDIHGYGIR